MESLHKSAHVEQFKTSSLTKQSCHKFGKKHDANFNLYLILDVSQSRHSLTDLKLLE